VTKTKSCIINVSPVIFSHFGTLTTLLTKFMDCVNFEQMSDACQCCPTPQDERREGRVSVWVCGQCCYCGSGSLVGLILHWQI